MNWVVTQHQFIWNNEQQFLNYLRRKLPVITGGGTITSFTTTGSSGAATFSGGVLNIPIYTGGGGGNLDATLALGGSLTADRLVTGANHVLTLDGLQLKFTNPKDPAILFTPYPITAGSTAYAFRAFNPSSNNIGAYEMLFDSNANGGPPNDNIWINGWNIDSRTDNTSPSWTQRLEYKYGGSLYEYHIQWSNAVNSIVNRLFSITFQDHGGINDLSTIFMQGNVSANFQNGGNSYWAVSGGNMVLNAGGARQVHWSVDDTNSVVNMYLDAGSASMAFNGFGFYSFTSSVANTSVQLGAAAGTPNIAVVASNAGVDLALISDHAIFINGGGSGSGDIARLSFCPPASGVNLARAYIDLNQGNGQMDFHVQGGGYLMSWDLGGAIAMQLFTTGLVMSVPLNTVATTAGTAGFRMPAGTAPTSPIDGDIWRQDNTNTGLKIRINGVTKTFTVT